MKLRIERRESQWSCFWNLYSGCHIEMARRYTRLSDTLKLSLDPDMTLRDGQVMGEGGYVFRYRVLGLIHPNGARIYNPGGEHDPTWQIIRIHGDKWADGAGSYPSAEAALAVLQAEVDKAG